MRSKHLFEVLSNLYALYIKTQCYHWNVTGANFASLHEMFGGQYKELAEQIDTIAEHIRILGDKVPASLKDFEKLNKVKNADESATAKAMIEDLIKSNKLVFDMIMGNLETYSNKEDFTTVDVLTEIAKHTQKTIWILSSSL